jgi:ornithine carbamoyltransferase
MSPHLYPAPGAAVGAPCAAGAEALTASARQLRAAAFAGLPQALLKGKNVGLLCDDPSQAEALLIYRAALGLGAQVALVRPGFDQSTEAEAVEHTARTLGRLYDAIACVALPAALVGQLRAAAGIPVLDDTSACGSTPSGQPAGAGDLPVAVDDRLYLWQAALIGSFA